MIDISFSFDPVAWALDTFLIYFLWQRWYKWEQKEAKKQERRVKREAKKPKKVEHVVKLESSIDLKEGQAVVEEPDTTDT
jgi:hypothetical protein